MSAIMNSFGTFYESIKSAPPGVAFPEQAALPGAFLFGSGTVLGPRRPVLTFGSEKKNDFRNHHLRVCHMRDGLKKLESSATMARLEGASKKRRKEAYRAMVTSKKGALGGRPRNPSHRVLYKPFSSTDEERGMVALMQRERDRHGAGEIDENQRRAPTPADAAAADAAAKAARAMLPEEAEARRSGSAAAAAVATAAAAAAAAGPDNARPAAPRARSRGSAVNDETAGAYFYEASSCDNRVGWGVDRSFNANSEGRAMTPVNGWRWARSGDSRRVSEQEIRCSRLTKFWKFPFF